MNTNRTTLTRVGVGLAVSALALTTAACGRGGSSGSGGSSDAARIAIVTRDFTNPYWAALRNGAMAEGKKEGVKVTVEAGDSETDSTGEDSAISTLASQNYNCFGVVPVNATNVITPLVPVARKKIPILNLDTQISASASKSAGVSYASFIGSDNLQAGKIAGQHLAQLMGGSGQVAILQGIAGEQNGINRENGFEAVTKGKLDVVAQQPANYDENTAITVTSAILKAHPGITGIFAANDNMGLGAAQAVKNAGLSGKVKIVSVDGITAALKAIQAGTLNATVTQYPYAEGQLAVQACMKLVSGKKVPSRVVAPIKLIDPSNVSQALSSFPEPFVPYDDPITGGTSK